ncbi:MAG: HlyC/CorC family transporter [Clostridia bacterium]|nr:HlyC/CorC family transporter [Clostridia bacterium]
MDDSGPANLALPIILLVLILIIEVFIYLLKSALTALTDSRAELLLEHPRKAVRRIVSNKDEVLLATSYGSIFLTLLFAFLANYAFFGRLCGGLQKAGLGLTGATVLSAFLICFAAAFLLMSAAGIIPRRIGLKRPVGVLTRIAPLASLFYSFNLPMVKCTNGISTLFMKLFGLDRMRVEDNVTEAEILSIVDAGGEAGTIEDEQREMINNIFEFDDVLVSDLMTHRTDVTALEAASPIDKLRDLAVEEGYSRIPVYKEDIDDIVGIAYSKDILRYVDGEVPKGATVADIMRDAFYVPETMTCDKLFKNMNEKHVQMAIAVDEYGGTAGIITLEDLLESIVGNIQDEYDDEEDEEIRRTDDGIFVMDGTSDIEEVEDELGIEFPEGDYDTVGGFIIASIDYIPEDGTTATVEYGGYVFTATDIEDRRIGRIRAEKLS